jgi:polyisoprenoid-binding protein YceI
MKILHLAITVLLCLHTIYSQETWEVDLHHSSVKFEIDHLMISTISGNFSEFYGELTLAEGQINNGNLTGFIEVKSINTGNSDRDNHLLKDDFFNAEEYERISFQTESITQASENKFRVKGNLTIKDVTRPIAFNLLLGGKAKVSGTEKMGLSGKFKINRFDYNIDWNGLLDTGSVMVGKEVTIYLNFELKIRNERE